MELTQQIKEQWPGEWAALARFGHPRKAVLEHLLEDARAKRVDHIARHIEVRLSELSEDPEWLWWNTPAHDGRIPVNVIDDLRPSGRIKLPIRPQDADDVRRIVEAGLAG